MDCRMGIRRLSISIAVIEARYSNNVCVMPPAPEPISKTLSLGLIFAHFTIFFETFLSIRKF